MILTTPRLKLRPVEEGDYPALREMFTDPLTQRYERDDLSEAHARKSFDLMIKDRDDPAQTRLRWMILVLPGETTRGWLHLDLLNEGAREYEIGWLVQRDYWGQGIASEAARAVLNFAFDRLHAHRVVAFCHAQNAASQKVMLKLGMQREAVLRESRQLHNSWYDELIYAILDHDPRPY
jgi:[ribosomal protein S5]-alanine N-acetyltransferase